MLEKIIKVAIVVLIVFGIISIFPGVLPFFTKVLTALIANKWGILFLVSCILIAIIG